MNYPYYGNFQSSYQPVQDNLQMMRNQQAIQQPVDDRIFVQGELAAQAYLVAPNSFVRLWDSQRNVFYEKRADASGRPYMEAYEYTKKTPAQTTSQTTEIDYEAKINALEKRIKALESMKGVTENVPESYPNDSTV